MKLWSYEDKRFMRKNEHERMFRPFGFNQRQENRAESGEW